MKIKKMADMERLTAVLERYGDAPHVRLKSSYCEGMRAAIGTCISLLAQQRPVDALELPKGRPGDYLEWDIGTGATRLYRISGLYIDADTVRYDLRDLCPVVDHGSIVRILKPEEVEG